MRYNILYDADSRLIVSDIALRLHQPPQCSTQDIYVGKGILSNLPAYVRKRGLGTQCVLVADDNTWKSPESARKRFWKKTDFSSFHVSFAGIIPWTRMKPPLAKYF